ncbi:MAG: ABC transporter permease [Acidimicrobiales bacterium]
MSVLSRGVRNAFRNGIRTFCIVVILGLSVGMALSMLLAREAVQAKIDAVEGSIGNIVTVTPAGVRGFAGGGEPLTSEQVAKVRALPHVAGVTETLQDRLTTADTNLQSALELGTLGRRFGGQDGQGDQGGQGTPPPEIRVPFGGQGAQGVPPTNFTPPLIVLGTSDPASLASLGGGTTEVTSGTAFAADSNDNVAMLGAGLAEKNGLEVGETFQAYGSDVTVTGIFSAGDLFSDAAVVMPIATVQRLSGQPGAVTSVLVRVDSIHNVDTAVESMRSTLGTSADVVSEQDTSSFALDPLQNIKSISLFSLTGAVAAGAVIIFLTMLMIVRERRREIAVLKAIGAPNRTVVSQFTYEAVTLTAMGAVLGLVAGALAANPITRLLVNSSAESPTSIATGPGPALRGGGGIAVRLAQNSGLFNLDSIHAAVGWDILGYGLLAALVIAVVGSAIPSLLISRVRPAETLRGE